MNRERIVYTVIQITQVSFTNGFILFSHPTRLKQGSFYVVEYTISGYTQQIQIRVEGSYVYHEHNEYRCYGTPLARIEEGALMDRKYVMFKDAIPVTYLTDHRGVISFLCDSSLLSGRTYCVSYVRRLLSSHRENIEKVDVQICESANLPDGGYKYFGTIESYYF